MKMLNAVIDANNAWYQLGKWKKELARERDERKLFLGADEDEMARVARVRTSLLTL